MPEFINPPPFGTVGDYSQDPNYAVGSTVTFSWTGSTSDSLGMNLWLKQDIDGFTCETLNLANTQCWLIHGDNDGTSFDWIVDVPDFDGASYNSSFPHYFVNFYDSDNTFGGVFASHYFNVLPSDLMPASATLTESTSSTTPTSTSISTTSTTTSSNSVSTTSSSTGSSTTSRSGSSSVSTSGSSTATSAGSTSSPSASASGMSDSAKIGLGVGVGVGVPLIIVLAVIAWLLYRNNRRRDGARTPMPEKESFTSPPRYQDAPDQYAPQGLQQPRVHEMSAQNFRITSPSELDAHPYR